MRFQCRVVPGELMCAMVTAKPDVSCSVATPSEFSTAPLECHHQLLKGIKKCLRTTKSWGVKCCRPKDELLNNPPKSDHQKLAPLPGVVGEFTVDISQPKSIGFVDASCGSEIRKQRSITVCFHLLWRCNSQQKQDTNHHCAQ